MSYEYSDRIILSGELMKYRKHLCEEIAKCSECNKCPAYIKEADKCALSLVIELAKRKNGGLTMTSWERLERG